MKGASLLIVSRSRRRGERKTRYTLYIVMRTTTKRMRVRDGVEEEAVGEEHDGEKLDEVDNRTKNDWGEAGDQKEEADWLD